MSIGTLDAEERDARYLAQQLATNSQILILKARMERARDELRAVGAEIAHSAGFTAPLEFRRARSEKEIIVPAIDKTRSIPRATSLLPEATVYHFRAKSTPPAAAAAANAAAGTPAAATWDAPPPHAAAHAAARSRRRRVGAELLDPADERSR